MTDFTLSYNQGDSVGRLKPNSDAALVWLDQSVEARGYQWTGPWLCIEHRYIDGIVAGIEDAGMTLSRDGGGDWTTSTG